MQRARNESSKDNRKQHILDCAEQIIISNGLDALSIARVAKESKLAVGTIYLYFEKKEDIIAQLTLKSRKVLLNKFIEYTQGPENALSQISNLLKAYYHFYKEFPYYNELVSFYETNAGLEEPEDLVSSSFAINQLVVEILKKGKLQGLIREEVNEIEFSFLLWGTAVGIIQIVEIKQNILKNILNINESDFFDSYIRLIINSLKV
ncbi:MAG TPA: TetR/AcrR family transcriptional regulator [Saprospiraceae bacterium]|nr:TetR/AcrR family transcriptional regulator [Saprospiraceae bacterium]HMU03942.1 TetR/AcrR family transcriptional regulator [Saprospiraceae bacterium]